MSKASGDALCRAGHHLSAWFWPLFIDHALHVASDLSI